MSLFDLAKQSLTVSLLKLRPNSLPRPQRNKSAASSSSFSLYGLVERLKSCRGVEVLHLISALPHSGLRPDLLELFESNHPIMSPFLIKYWCEVCDREFPRMRPEEGESWYSFYRKQVESSKSKIEAAGLRLRDSYKGEEKKVHQLKTISSAPSAKRSKPASTLNSNSNGNKRPSLMEKSRQEAMNSSIRSSMKSGVTFRMRQPSQRR